MKRKIRNKEISWLGFNARLLQEASDPTVPLLDRLKFLGIYSSNLDEFFRIRVATLKRIAKLGKAGKGILADDPKDVLKEIRKTVLAQREIFDATYERLLEELRAQDVWIVDETELCDTHREFVREHFSEVVRPRLMPIMMDQVDALPPLRDHGIYLAVLLRRKDAKELHALLEVPTDVLPRFVHLPAVDGKQHIMLLDDVIRFSLPELFSQFNVDVAEAFTLKMTRDAELEIDDDLSESLMRKVSKSLKKRKAGQPVRLIYDAAIPGELLEISRAKLGLESAEVETISAGRYHNHKDFMGFPSVGNAALRSRPIKPLPHPDLEGGGSLLKQIGKTDVLLAYPYQSFDYIIDLLREASIDPKVTTIKMTLYRVARDSNVVSALINAAKNGKQVTVVVELQARFDEAANIEWSDRLQDEGVTVIHGAPGLKVHAKLLLIERRKKKDVVRYACVGTGNFNETTAKVYSDHALLTSHEGITSEVASVFDFLENNFSRTEFEHLVVSPFDMRDSLNDLISREIKQAKRGNEAYIIVKLNNLTDSELIERLYDAAEAGVQVRLMVRGMFSPVPAHENIEAYGLVDRFLEHTRLIVFCNGGKERYFVTSADWMPRNLDRRVEVTCPIYDPRLQKEVRHFLDVHWKDTVKNRILDGTNDNSRVSPATQAPVRAQLALYRHFERGSASPVSSPRKAKAQPPAEAGADAEPAAASS